MKNKSILVVPIVLLALFAGLFMLLIGIHYVCIAANITIDDKSAFKHFLNDVLFSKTNKLNFQVSSKLKELIKDEKIYLSLNAAFSFLFALMTITIFFNASLRWFKNKTLFPYLYFLLSLGFVAYTYFAGVNLLFFVSFIPFILLILSLPTFTFYVAKREKTKKVKEAKVKKVKTKKCEVQNNEVIDEIQQTMSEIEQPIQQPEPIAVDPMRIDQQRLLDQQHDVLKNLEALKGKASGLNDFLLNAQQQMSEIEQPIQQPEPIAVDPMRVDQQRLLDQQQIASENIEALKGRANNLNSLLLNMQPQLSPTERVQSIRETIGEDKLKRPYPEILRMEEEKINQQLLNSQKNIESLQSKYANVQLNLEQVAANYAAQLAVAQQPEPIAVDPMRVDQQRLLDQQQIALENIEALKSKASGLNDFLLNAQQQSQQVGVKPQQNLEPQVEIMRANQQALLERQQFANQNIDALRSRFLDVYSNLDKQASMYAAQQAQQQSVQTDFNNNFFNSTNNSEIQKMFDVIKIKRQSRGR